VDPEKRRIFEAWADYDHAIHEESKIQARDLRAVRIREMLKKAKITAEIGDFLHHFRDDYRQWLVADNPSRRKRF
jgi:predicted secreted acid phosphatase